MSGKVQKKVRKAALKYGREYAINALATVENQPLRKRLGLAWCIIRKKDWR